MVSTDSLAMFGGLGGLLLNLVIIVGAIAAYWKIFTMAGEEGWKAIIPIFKIVVLLKIVGRPWWWLLLMLVPIVNFVVAIVVMNDLSKSLGHGVGFTLGLIFQYLDLLPDPRLRQLAVPRSGGRAGARWLTSGASGLSWPIRAQSSV